MSSFSHDSSATWILPHLISRLGRFSSQREKLEGSLNVEILPRPFFDLVIPVEGRPYKIARDSASERRSRPNFMAFARLHAAVLTAVEERQAALTREAAAVLSDDDDDMFLGLLPKKTRVS